MNQYLAGTTVILPIAFEDESGNALQVSEASYRIVDQEYREIVASTQFDPTLTSLSIAAEYNSIELIDPSTITANTMDSLSVDQMRTVEFDITLADGNTIAYSVSYLLYPRERLIVGLNSFQNSQQAKLTAYSIPDVETFVQATDAQRIAALVEAKVRISRLSLTAEPNGMEVIDFGELTPNDYNTLPERLKAALRKAQVAEANVILGGGNIVEQMRQMGLLSQTIGETHETYRQTAMPEMGISKTAYKYLSAFMITGKKLTRT